MTGMMHLYLDSSTFRKKSFLVLVLGRRPLMIDILAFDSLLVFASRETIAS